LILRSISAWVFGRRRLGGNHPVDIISDMTFFYFLAKFFSYFYFFFFLLFGRHSNQESWTIFLFGLLAMRRHKFVIFQGGFSRICFFEIIRKANDLVAQQQQQLGTSSK
jgi:uncharacterized membrane protein